jgi:hypothetical protein
LHIKRQRFLEPSDLTYLHGLTGMVSDLGTMVGVCVTVENGVQDDAGVGRRDVALASYDSSEDGAAWPA